MLLQGKKIAVFGIGVSGQAALKWLCEQRAEVYAIDRQVPSCSLSPDFCFAESGADKLLSEMDMIILSPGIPREHPVLKRAHAKGVNIRSEVDLAADFFQAPVYALSGTNGKTTTLTLLYELLKASGKKVFLGGNIGTPFCEALLDDKVYDLAILELSSFQLESSPALKLEAGALLNLSPSHSERYQRVEDYARAKLLMAENIQSQAALFVDSSFKPYVRQRVDWRWVSAEKAIEYVQEQIDVKKLKLCGRHNWQNIYYALALLECIDSAYFQSRDWEASLYQFSGVEHRLEYLGERAHYPIFNDAKSTNLEATRKAVESLAHYAPDLCLIMGGQLRGGECGMQDLVEQLQGKLSEIWTIGEAASSLEKVFRGRIPVENKYNLQTCVEAMRERNGAVLFSPGFPSFDQFKDYAERGRTFKNLVEPLIQTKAPSR